MLVLETLRITLQNNTDDLVINLYSKVMNEAITQGPHSRISMVERSKGFLWVGNFGLKGFFGSVIYARIFGGFPKGKDFYGHCFLEQCLV